MMSKVLLSSFFASAIALTLKTAHVKEFTPCKLHEGPVPAVKLALDSDEDLDRGVNISGNTNSSESDLKKYEDALEEYKEKKQAFMLAESKLMSSMEALLKTPLADAEVLANASTGKLGKDALIVFYAPWCPHCQQFVLHDESGNPQRAPLELLRKEMAENQKFKDVKVYRSDVTRLEEQDIPQALRVESIPTLFYVNTEGKAIKFNGNPHDTDAIKEFLTDPQSIPQGANVMPL